MIFRIIRLKFSQAENQVIHNLTDSWHHRLTFAADSQTRCIDIIKLHLATHFILCTRAEVLSKDWGRNEKRRNIYRTHRPPESWHHCGSRIFGLSGRARLVRPRFQTTFTDYNIIMYRFPLSIFNRCIMCYLRSFALFFATGSVQKSTKS